MWDLCLGGTQLNEHENVHHSIIYSTENIGSFLCPTNTLWLIPLKNTIKLLKNENYGTVLVVQWLRLHPSTAGGMDNIHGWGTKILHAMWDIQNVKKRERERDRERENYKNNIVIKKLQMT